MRYSLKLAKNKFESRWLKRELIAQYELDEPNHFLLIEHFLISNIWLD